MITKETFETRERIRKLLRARARPNEIIRELGLPRSTYFRHLKAIRKEDLAFMNSLRGKDFASNVVLAIQGLEDSIRKLIVIADTAERDADKIEAINLRVQTELDLLNLAKLGPSSVPYSRIESRVRDLDFAATSSSS